MAKKIITLLTDDIDGSEASETLHFAFDGSNYSIDLNEKNAAAFRQVMDKFRRASTRTGRHVPVTAANGYRPGITVGQAASRNSQSNRDQNQAIRTWALKNGYDLAERGRIPQQIVEAYNKGLPNQSTSQPLLDVIAPAPEPKKTVPAKAAPAKKAAPARKAAASRR